MNQVLTGMLQSKTMWFSLATTALGVISTLQDHSALVLALAPQLGPILTVLGLVAGVLRVLTESTPSWKAAAPLVTPPAQASLPLERSGD